MRSGNISLRVTSFQIQTFFTLMLIVICTTGLEKCINIQNSHIDDALPLTQLPVSRDPPVFYM